MASTKKPKTQADLARALNVTRQAVSQWIAAGLPRPPAGTPWDLAAVRRWRRERQAERAAATAEAGAIDAARRAADLRQAAPASVAAAEREYAARVASGESPRAIALESTTRYRLARAKTAEAELAVLRGQLIQRDAAEERMVEILSSLRSLLLALPARVDAELAAELDPTEVRQVLRRDIIALLGAVQQMQRIPESWDEVDEAARAYRGSLIRSAGAEESGSAAADPEAR
jgi:phage terminase Nu1 subunit (DNA packaging protein)